ARGFRSLCSRSKFPWPAKARPRWAGEPPPRRLTHGRGGRLRRRPAQRRLPKTPVAWQRKGRWLLLRDENEGSQGARPPPAGAREPSFLHRDPHNPAPFERSAGEALPSASQRVLACIGDSEFLWVGLNVSTG